MSKKPFDYSKWDNIELSDDEDDVHPNIDRESWFRMKHRSRVEREEREEEDKKKILNEMSASDLRIKEITKILDSMANGEDSDDELEDEEGLKAELDALNAANKARQDKLDQYEKNKKWNADNMCHVVEERTIVNANSVTDKFTETGFALPSDDNAPKKVEPSESDKSDTKASSVSQRKEESAPPTTQEAIKELTKSAPKKLEPKPAPAPVKPKAGPDSAHIAMMTYHDFTEKYADLLEEFMAISSMDQTREFLIQHGNVLLQENASNYLLLASLEDEMNGFRDKMRLTARQSQIVSNIAELAKTMRTHPGNVINPFFKRLEEKQHLEGFNIGLETFIQNLIKRAVVKKKEFDQQRAEEEGVDLKDIPREERLGPGGLDPVEVFESLPTSMQEAFESRDTDKLKEALMAMPPEEAEMHMKRCVDSGLWNEG
jgi:cell division cycle protein 37